VLDQAVIDHAGVLESRLVHRLGLLEEELVLAEAACDHRQAHLVAARIAQAACRLDAARLIRRRTPAV
jgi:molybdopterin synthase catalytic subunit